MNLFALGAGFLSVAIYVWIMRRAPTSPTCTPSARTDKETVERKVGAAFLILLVLCLPGLAYPWVKRADSTTMYTAWVVLRPAFLLAMGQSLWMGMVMRGAAYPGGGMLAALSVVLFGILNIGAISFVNGALDFSPSQRHTVRVLSKRFSRGGTNSRPSYVFFTNDWASGRMVRFEVSKSFYSRVSVGMRLGVEVGQGLLGIEWMRGFRIL